MLYNVPELVVVSAKLELPSSSPILVYVCYVKSTNNIAIRIIGEEYSVESLSLREVLFCYSSFFAVLCYFQNAGIICLS